MCAYIINIETNWLQAVLVVLLQMFHYFVLVLMRRAFFFVNSIALPKPSTTFTMFLQSLFISNLLLLLMREE